ncbi:hypothetical protein [Streptomyces gardneri]|uniref:hypothetical protein n=1 Tax=Streptomyces gardneri TaxID=66892 RepID=UPI003691F213
MTHTLDPARTQLLARLQALPRFRDHAETVLVRRISRMSDRQVAAVLVMSDEELEEQSKPVSGSRYAPATDDSARVTLWYHGTVG